MVLRVVATVAAILVMTSRGRGRNPLPPNGFVRTVATESHQPRVQLGTQSA